MNVIVKLTFPDGSTRRATVSRDAGIKDLKAKARALLGETDPASDAPADVSVQYQDSDGDWIWVVTDAELAEYMAASEAANKVPKFTVKPAAKPATNANADSDEPEAQAQEEPPREPTPEPEDPMIVLARALANPTTVQLLQAQLASSPVVTDAVVSVANGFVEGGPLRAAEAAMEALPNVKAAAMDAVKQDADLHDAVQGAIDHVESGAAHMPFAPWAAFMHGPFRGGGWHGRGGGGCHGRGGGGWHGGRGGWHGGWHGGHGHGHGCGPHQAHAQAQPQGPGVHPFVFCDACSASEELKAKSKLAGNISFRGWIAGPRFRSKTIHDFDLCESCHKTSQFAETHGPFERIEPRVAGFCEGGAGAGANANAGAGAGPGAHPWAGRGGPWGGRGGGWGGCRPGGPRGCRGSGRRGFADVVAETLGRCAEAVNEVADESSELAQIARAIQESLKTQTQAPGVGIDKVVQPGRAEAKAEAAAKPEAKAEAAAKPAPEATPEAKPETRPEAKPASPKHSSRSSDDSDEWVVEEDPMVKWRDALQRLHALGFTDSHEYLAMLEEEKGDLERVINRIIRRNA